MEVELKININPTNLPPITKDPVFWSTETDTLFILIVNLKGYQKEKLKIDKNEDGTQIAVSGEKVGAGLQSLRRIAFRVGPQVTKFRKVFWIPDGVVLDQIKARFNEKQSVLWIFMPKSVAEFSGVVVGVEEVKEEEIGKGSHRRARPVPDKVPKREIPRKSEQEMKEGKKDVPQHEPENIPQEMKEGKDDVKVTDEVVGGQPQHEPGQVKEAIPEKEAAERESPRKNEQERKEGRKDVEATNDDMGRLHHHEPEQVKEALPEKEADEKENTRKNEQEKKERKGVKATDDVGRLHHHEPEQVKEEGKEEVKATDEVVGRLPRHEPEQIKDAMLKKEAADVTITRREEETVGSHVREVPSNEETPAKGDSDLEARSTAAQEKSEERQHSPEVTESTNVEAVKLTQRAHVEEYNAPEENGEVATHPSQQELNTEIQEESQLKSDQASDPTESLKPDHPEEVQGMGNELAAEVDPVIPHEEKVDIRKGSPAPPKKFRLFSPCFLAGSAILVTIAVLAIHLSRRKR